MDLALENKLLKEQVAQLKHELEQLKKLVFGSQSEKFKPTVANAHQLSLFDLDPLQGALEEQPEEHISITKKKPAKKHPGRYQIPEHFPVEEIIIEPEQDTTDMVKVGELISEYVEYTPSVLKKVRVIRPKYAPKQKEGAFAIADLPSRALPKSVAGNSLLTSLLITKFVEHMSFYRQRQAIKRDFDWDIPPNSINDWYASVCTLLKPLYEHLKQKVLASGYLQVDESPIKVLDKDKKGSTHQGYQWVYHSPELNMLFFNYRKGRGVNGPKEMLISYQGLLQSDGYSVYDKIGETKGITLAACIVHVRRYYDKALQTDKQRASYALGIFKQVYKYESEIRDLPPQERLIQRNKKLRPLLDKLKSWIDQECIKVLPKSPIGKAMAYTQNQWAKVMEILNDGRYELDNNLIENKIRPLALGRKNYLFAGSHDGARRIAMMYSFFGSCAAQGINPSKWLMHVLDNIADTKITDLDRLLPNYDLLM